MAAERPVRIPADGLVLDGLLGIPPGAVGIVLFAHGSGSSRLSPRNAFVARELRRAKMATLLFDLLSAEESEEPALVFDVELLARRLRAATDEGPRGRLLRGQHWRRRGADRRRRRPRDHGRGLPRRPS